MPNIDRKTLAYTIPIKDGDKSWTLYIPSPTKERVEACVPILGHLFSLRTKLPPLVIAKDYEYYVKEACTINAKRITDNEKEEESISSDLYNKFKDFLEVSIMGGHAINGTGKAVAIDKAVHIRGALNDAMGLYVFFYSFYHYSATMISKSDIEGFITQLPLTEYMKLSLTSSSDKENSPEKETA